MQLTNLDWTIIGSYFALALGWVGKQTSKTERRRLLSRRPQHALVAPWRQHGRDNI